MGVRINTQLSPDTNLEIARPGYIDTKKDPAQTDPLFFDQYDFTDQYTDPLHTYTKYGVGPTRFGDWNEERAVQQSTGEKWRRGLAKGAITTLGAVAENTLGVLAGLGEVLSGGQYYDNAVGRSIDKMNAWAREEMPNYYTQAEEDKGAFARMGTANFWADKALNGLGYSLGSVATMLLTGGAGYVGMAARAIKVGQATSLANKTAKIHKLYKVAKTAARGEKLSKMMGQVSQAQRWQRAGQMADAAIMMSLAESSVESRETKKHVYDSLVQLEMEKQGVEYAHDLGAEKLMEIQKDANAAGNANFGMNMGVLSLSNAFMFGKMLGPKFIPGQQVIRGIKKTGTDKWADTTVKGWRKGYKKTKPFLQTSMAEAAQEGSQYASNISATEFATAKYSDQGGMTRMHALHEGLSRTFGETDGVESMLLGAVTGGFMGGAGSLISKPAKARDQRAEGVLNILNSGAMSSTIERSKNQERVLYFIKKMEEAREQGNEELFEQYRTQAIISDAITLDEAGQIDLYYEKLDDTLSLSDEDFAKEFGYNPDAKFDKHKVVEDLKKDIALAVKRKNALDSMFPITQTTGVPKMLMSEEARKEEDSKNMETLMLRDHLLQNAVFLDKVSDRKKDVANRVSEMVPGITLGLLEKAADNAKERYDSLIEEAIIKTEGVTNEQELPQELRDAAAEEAKVGYVQDVLGGLNEKTKINPVDQKAIGTELSTYYGLHSNEQDMFENWNRLQTAQGRDSWLRVALMDREIMIKEDADAAVEDLIQQEIDPEKLAKNTPINASPSQKRKVKKEAKNINNIKKNIIDKFNDPAVTMDEIDAAIDARAGAEEAYKEGFESTEEKQAYIELQTLRQIKKQREGNPQQENENKDEQEVVEKSKEVVYTAMLVDDPSKLKKVYKPVHLNEYYHHSTIQFRPANLDNIEVGKKHKLKIIGRLKTDRVDVILVESTSENEFPHITLSTAEGVQPVESNEALKYASEKGTIQMYKSPKYVQVTEGYVDGNGISHTTTLEENTPQEQIDSPAKVDEQGQTEMVFESKESELEDHFNNPTYFTINEDGNREGPDPDTQTELYYEEIKIREEINLKYDQQAEGIIEEEVGQDAEFTDDSEFVIFEDEFVDPEILAQELAAQNEEAAAIAGEEIQELGAIPTQDEILALETEQKALLEEEAKLNNSLNKEDENCAT